MIKKNTKVFFLDGRNSEDLEGGMPLSKGEIIHIHDKGKIVDYIVAEKEINCFLDKEVVDITYKLKRK